MRLPEPVQIGLRLSEAVDMVDADAGERPVLGELGGDRVDHLGHRRLLGADRHEVVDGEEAPNVAQRIAPPLQAVVLTVHGVGDIEVLGARRERESQWPVAEFRPEIAVTDREPTVGEHLVERVAELGDHDPAVGRIPVDVEPFGRRRVAAVAQHLPPALVEVRFGDRHVVGHVVDDHAESPVIRRIEQRAQAVRAAEVGAHLRVVDHVVAVETARNRFGNR